MCIAEDILQIKKDLCAVRRTYVNTLEVVLRSKVEHLWECPKCKETNP